MAECDADGKVWLVAESAIYEVSALAPEDVEYLDRYQATWRESVNGIALAVYISLRKLYPGITEAIVGRIVQSAGHSACRRLLNLALRESMKRRAKGK